MKKATLILCAASCLSSCGGASEEAPKVVSVEDYETSTFSVAAGEGDVEGLLGNVTSDEIERVFSNHRSGMARCYQDAIEDLEEIEGDLRFQLEVASDGTVNSAFLIDGDLGSLETELCMVDLVKGFSFNRAPGGVAVIDYPMTLEAPYDHPAFVSWPDSQIDKVVSEHRDVLDRCGSDSAGIHLTLYVGMGGVVLSAGGTAESLERYDAAVCAARAARSWTFPDPGSKIVKVRVDL